MNDLYMIPVKRWYWYDDSSRGRHSSTADFSRGIGKGSEQGGGGGGGESRVERDSGKIILF